MGVECRRGDFRKLYKQKEEQQAMELIEWILREENLEQAIYNLICENKHLTVEQVMAEFDISRATVFRDYAKIKKITGAVYDKNESVWKL